MSAKERLERGERIIGRNETYLVCFNAKLAKHWRDNFNFERQRNIRPEHVSRLAVEMKRGRFLVGTQIHLCRLGLGIDEGAALVNGNHTLEALIQADVEIVLSVLVTYVADEGEIAVIYGRHDLHRVRDMSATLRGAGVYETIGGTIATVNAFAAAVRLNMIGLDRIHGKLSVDPEITLSRDVRMAAMEEYKEYAELYFAAIKGADGKNRNLLKRAAVMAVGLETFRYCAVLAIDFWTGTANDDGLRKVDPRKKLLKWLEENPSAVHHWQTTVYATALCWNAFFQHRELAQLKPSAVTRFELCGTPWRAGKRPAPMETVNRILQGRDGGDLA